MDGTPFPSTDEPSIIERSQFLTRSTCDFIRILIFAFFLFWPLRLLLLLNVLSLLGAGMKLHEKILAHFQSCTSPVDKEGFLYKKKKRNASYHRRWFVLKANLLFYQERPADRHLLGVIVLEGCAVRSSESDGRFVFSLVFQGLKSYVFAAGDRRTQESWVQALSSASHRYLSMLLRDLRRQYEEAKQQQGSCESSYNSSACSHTDFFSMLGATTAVREGRSLSASNVLQTPTQATGKKSPIWLRKKALVTPLSGPAASCGQWPLLDFNPLEDFRELHEHYGQEVKKAREEWLKSRGEESEGSDLG